MKKIIKIIKKTIVVNEIARNKKQARTGEGVRRVRSHFPTVARGPLFLLIRDLKQSEVTVLFYSNLQIVY